MIRSFRHARFFSSITLSRSSNQAAGLAEYAKNFVASDPDKSLDPKVS